MRLSLCFAPLITVLSLVQPGSTLALSAELSHFELAKVSVLAPVSAVAQRPDNRPLDTAEAASSAVSQSSPRFAPFFQSESTEHLSDFQWLLLLSIVLTTGAIGWGVSQYGRQQKWQRIEFLRQAVKEFEQDPDVHNALKILDFEEYRDYQIQVSSLSDFSQSGPTGEKNLRFRVTDTLLCNALANHDQRARQKHQLDYCHDHDAPNAEALRQYQIETALRDWFNTMLNGLEHFGYFIESGMFTVEELRPWLNYWIKLVADPAYRRPGASKLYDALYSYIHHSGFFGVQKLFERFGYRILPSPYLDTDLVNLGRASGRPAGDYDTRLALTLAKASYLAYQDKQFVAEVVGRWGAAYLEDRARYIKPESVTQQSLGPRGRRSKNDIIRHNFRYFNNRGRDTQAYLFRTDEFMVLAFRGSQEPQDWLTNFTTQLRNFTVRKEGATGLSSYKGRVHTGFFLAWAIIEKSVMGQIQRWQRELATADKRLPPLYITGHSLGGALATMAAAALVDNGIEVAGVYTFGQPRVGDRTFVSQLNLNTKGRVFRFVNNNDVVPHVPPPFSIWNPTRLYGHVGTAKYFNAKGMITANYKLAARFTDYSVGLLKGVFGAGFNLITDHNMEYYISHLDNALMEELEDKVAQKLERGNAP